MIALALCVLVIGGILAFFVSIYAVRGYDEPIGYDTPRYIWRTDCVEVGGLQELRRCGSAVYSGLPNRIANPLLSLMLTSAIPMSRLTFAAILPAVAAVGIALAGASLVSISLGPAPGRFAALAIILGTSTFVVSLAAPEGFADTMVALALGLAGFAFLALAAQNRIRYAWAVPLFAGALLVHWGTGLLLCAVLTLVSLAYALPGVKQREASVPRWPRVSARLALALASSLLLWAAVVVVGVRSFPDRFGFDTAHVADLVRSRFVSLGLPIAVPAAVIGWVQLRRSMKADGRPPGPRFLFSVLSSWVAVIVIGMTAWLLGWALPAHRLLVLALPIPILSGIALLWVGDVAGRNRRSLGAGVVVLGCLVAAAAGYALWERASPPLLDSERVDVAAAARSYLTENVPEGTRVALVADLRSVRPDVLWKSFLVALPPELISDVTFVDALPRPHASHDEDVVLVADGYSRDFEDLARTEPDRVVAPGVIAVRGPMPQRPVPGAPRYRVGGGAAELMALAAPVVLVLILLGMGWVHLALGQAATTLERIGLAPALGVIAVVMCGLITDRLRFALGGTAPEVAVVLAGLGSAGASLATFRARRQRSKP